MADRVLPSRQWFRDHAGVMLDTTLEDGEEEWVIVGAYASGDLKTEAEWREVIDYEAATDTAVELLTVEPRWDASATQLVVDAALPDQDV